MEFKICMVLFKKLFTSLKNLVFEFYEQKYVDPPNKKARGLELQTTDLQLNFFS